MFTGDQLGSLFAHHIFEIYKSAGKPVEKLAMVASTVSSKMVEAIAKKEGFKFVECLTGSSSNEYRLWRHFLSYQNKRVQIHWEYCPRSYQ
jgi:phosphomannomutase